MNETFLANPDMSKVSEVVETTENIVLVKGVQDNDYMFLVKITKEI